MPKKGNKQFLIFLGQGGNRINYTLRRGGGEGKKGEKPSESQVSGGGGKKERGLHPIRQYHNLEGKRKKLRAVNPPGTQNY